MTVITSKDLVSYLLKKGFEVKEGGNHQLYYFIYEGKRTNIRVPISRGSKSTYSGSLLASVIKQMCLDKIQFLEFIECSMSEEVYIEHLKNIGKVED